MKKIIVLLLLVAVWIPLIAQNNNKHNPEKSNCTANQWHYWVFLADKAGVTFDPYSYFDAKAIERYHRNNADLYDSTNYPINESYLQQIAALLSSPDHVFGESRCGCHSHSNTDCTD